MRRAGHCSFTDAEQISALQTLEQRIDTGKWTGSTDPNALNAAASALGPTYNPLAPSFVEFDPAPFLRPYDLEAP